MATSKAQIDLPVDAAARIAEVPGPSALPAFFRRITNHQLEHIVYDDGWRGRSYSYPEIGRMAGAFAARLRAGGIRKGECVMVWSESRPAWVAAFWGCILEGVVLVPLEPQTSRSLAGRIEQKVQPRALLLGDRVAGPDETSRTPVWFLRDIEKESADLPAEPPALSSSDVAEIVFTSGTTGEPKGVIITHGNLAASLRPLEEQIAPYRKYVRLLFPRRLLNLLPLSHLFGQALTMFLPPLFPAAVTFISTVNPEEIARQIRSRRICALVAVPRVLELLRDFVRHRFPEAGSKAAGSIGPVRWWRARAVHRLFGYRFCCLIVGGAPLPADLEQFWTDLGFVVAQGYGLTETAPIISFNLPFEVQAGSAGKPLPGVDIRIAQDGEVLVRGRNVTPGYFKAPVETAAAFSEGWFHTGDIGELSAAGDLIIRGRKKEMIVTPEGLKIFPEDIEAVLNGIPGVRESAVIGKDRVEAVLVLQPGVDGEQVIREANQRLEDHQKVRAMTVWLHGELPRTQTTHKLKHKEIAATLRGERPGPQPGAGTKIDRLIQKYAPGRTIRPDTTLDELGLSSLDRLELMMDMEEHLGTSIDEGAFASVSTVADLSRPMERVEAAPMPRFNRRWPARLVRRFSLATIFLPITRIFARIHVSGLENLRGLQGPVVFAANHQSNFDTPSVLSGLPRYWRYRIAPAMWKEYFDAHFFPERHSWRERWGNSILYFLLTLLFNTFPVPQTEAGTRQTIRYVGELVEEGWSILIFPEGERTETGEIGRFFPGVGMIASRMQIPVVPIRLIGLDKVLHRYTVWPRRGPVEVKIGAPLLLKGESYKDLAKQVEDAVRGMR
ncbi:MAG: AMP-binding protein [Acidobacteriia bacterium]|nr:AMP-binding protein [Terriglobia bacterium]